MYNTVGETAGVTQDVGSDPTVRKFGSLCDVGCEEGVGVGEGEGWCWWFCTFCGREVVCEEDGKYESETGKEEVKTVKVRMIDMAEMSKWDDEDMDVDMDEEVEGETSMNTPS